LDKNPPRVKTNITYSDSSDADVTLELTPSRMALLVEPDRTSEVDALDILEASVIVTEAPRAVLPRTLPPPRRTNEPTKLIRRDLIDRLLKQKRARTALMLAAALGTWAFFASFAIVGVYGASRIANHFSHHEAAFALGASPSTPAADVAPVEKSEALPPLEVDANRLARVSAAIANASVDTSPRASVVSHDEIFRRPSKTQVGVLRVSSSVRGLLVDGTPERVTGGSIILACGDHRIRPPHASARVVRVPCGKTVAL
jgi:hypothetical protein